MQNWEKDIRRSLPEYQGREGDVVFNAPYRATDADLNAFVLYADTSALQGLIDAELKACVDGPALVGSQEGLRFTCVDPWIVLIYAAFRSFTSTDEVDRSEGRDQAFELSIWVPIVKEQVVAGVASSEPAWFLPIVYTSPTASVATGREVFGYPKVPAYLEIPDEGGPPIAVQLREELDGESPGAARNAERFFLAPQDGCPTPPGWNVDVNANPQLAAIVSRYLANHPIVFRKQVGMLQQRDEVDGPTRVVAGYTALIESRVPITRLRSLNSIGRGSLFNQGVGGLDRELARRLGLKGLVPQFGIALRDCRLDIQHGREIWVSSERREFIKPLPAPGNSIIWDPHPFSASAAASAQTARSASRASKDDGADTVEGVAEAYFGSTRRFAIESLLARHFPAHLDDRPTPDPKRDFVKFLFVRAHAGQAVRLYEFSVWVPVLHQGAPAWYSPYMFRSPGSAVIQARQRFGHPCQQGFVDFDNRFVARTVTVRRPQSRGKRGLEWVRQEGIQFHKLDGAHRSAVGSDVAMEALKLDVDQRVVGLLQFRHAADTTRACFQEIVSSGRKFIGEGEPRDIGRWKATLPGELRFGRLLDLSGDSQTVHGYRYDTLRIETSARSTLREGKL